MRKFPRFKTVCVVIAIISGLLAFWSWVIYMHITNYMNNEIWHPDTVRLRKESVERVQEKHRLKEIEKKKPKK